MANGHGGKRTGAGRPKGATSINAELRSAAQQHSEAALNVLVEIMNDKEHPQRLKAAEMVLTRGHGSPKESSASYDIITSFMAGDISAVEACLMMESEGLKVPDTLKSYYRNQLAIVNHIPFSMAVEAMEEPPNELPRR